MGAIHVDVTIRNPGDRRRSWTAPFLVGDTIAAYVMLGCEPPTAPFVGGVPQIPSSDVHRDGPRVPDVEIAGIRVVQASGGPMDDPVPLIAGERAVASVYVTSQRGVRPVARLGDRCGWWMAGTSENWNTHEVLVLRKSVRQPFLHHGRAFARRLLGGWANGGPQQRMSISPSLAPPGFARRGAHQRRRQAK